VDQQHSAESVFGNIDETICKQISNPTLDSSLFILVVEERIQDFFVERIMQLIWL